MEPSAELFETRGRRVGLAHAAFHTAAITLFTVAVLLRSQEPGLAASPLALVLELAGLAALMVGGWLGGELLERLGIGVDARAHPAGSSLVRPADGASVPRIAHPEHVGVQAPDTDPRVEPRAVPAR